MNTQSSRRRHWTVDRLLVAAIAVVTFLGAFIADALGPGAAQHILNPNWPPHAKFHDAQYIVMSMILAVIALVLLSRKVFDGYTSILVAAAILSTPWLGMFGALLFPGTAMLDPEFDTPSAYLLGQHPQVWIATVILLVLLVAVVIATRRCVPPSRPAVEPTSA